MVVFDGETEEHCIAEINMKLLHTSRGFLMRLLHSIYKKVFKLGSKHTVDLHSELTMLSIEFESGREENRLERYCIIFGWILLACGYPGIATLRTFRVFRILWYYDIPVLQKYLNFNFEEVFFGTEKQKGTDYTN
jgi:hypothetical protein